MKKALFSLSLRARLLLGGVAVNVMMLALLVVNGISIMDGRLDEQARIHVEEQKHLLNAALSLPLAAGQDQALAGILESVRSNNGIIYLVLFDRSGNLAASAGWERSSPLPPVEPPAKKTFIGQTQHVHNVMDIEAGGRKVGQLHFGLSTAFMNNARADLVRENLVIGGIALILSIVSMIALSYWLTRSLAQLREATPEDDHRAAAEGA